MTLTESTLRALGPMGGEIYAELVLGPWSKPASRGIEELAAAVGSTPGAKRARHEDRALLAEVSTDRGDRYRAAIVCDGVGGSEMGDVAATIATAAFLGRLGNTYVRRPLESLLVELVHCTDEVVRAELRGKGTTTMSVILATESGELAAANIGDSRIFSWEPGRNFTQVSTDDTMENEFRNMSLKDPSVLDAKGLRGTLSQAIGEVGQGADRLRITTFSKRLFPAGAILATDGAWKGNEPTFRAVVENATSGIEVIRRILTIATWTGGTDNASIIAIDNLTTFAKAAPSRPQRHVGCVSLWINDTKIVVHGGNPTFHPRPQTPSPKEKAEPRKRGDDDRRRRGRADNQRKQSAKSDDQLRLIPEDGMVSRRPKIEISTEFAGGDAPSP
jgi:serine/threonine protein phosphatase PrpC